MLRTIGNTFGGVMAMLCLTSTFTLAQSQSPSWHYTTPAQLQAQAQPQSREMTCTTEDGNGNCTAGIGTDDQVIAVVGENVHTGEKMTCVATGTVMHCVTLAMRE